jgi:UDP-galactopyranose mutase
MSVVSLPASTPRDLLLCLSHLRWNFVWQRPQHLLSRAAKDYQVVFFEEPIHEDVSEPDLKLQWHGEILVATPVLPHDSVMDANTAQEALLDRVLGLFNYRRLVTWYYTPMALPFSEHLPSDCVVFDCMDELSNFHGAPRDLREREQQLMDMAQVVFTGGESLYNARKGRHQNIHCFPSSIDAAHFERARTLRAEGGEEPADQAAIPHPRIGFFGVIDERLDVALLRGLALARPDWQFVMIGPVVKIDPATLPQLPNIHWLGGKTYAQLPAYLAGWDAGFMPFAINEATRFISPTKTPEFLAAGLPVVSTPIRDVVRTYGRVGLVDIAAGPLDMAAALGRCVAGRDASWRDAVDRKLAQSSWDRTWADMNREIVAITGAQTTRGKAAAAAASGRAAVRPPRPAQGATMAPALVSNASTALPQSIAPLTAQGAGASHV